MMSFCDDKQANIIDAFNTSSIYLGDISSKHLSQIYPSDFNLIKPCFWTSICPFLKTLLLLYMINMAILKLSISHF